MPYTDQQLREAVDAVFAQFDKDNSNSLDANEVYNLISAALKHMNSGAQVSQQQVQGFVQAVDKSGDGKIQKPELYEIFKKVLQWLFVNPYPHFLIHINISKTIYNRYEISFPKYQKPNKQLLPLILLKFPWYNWLLAIFGTLFNPESFRSIKRANKGQSSFNCMMSRFKFSKSLTHAVEKN